LATQAIAPKDLYLAELRTHGRGQRLLSSTQTAGSSRPQAGIRERRLFGTLLGFQSHDEARACREHVAPRRLTATNSCTVDGRHEKRS
jgi:hypothetical protein